MVLGFSKVDYTAGEGSEVAGVTVELLFGQLGRSIAVWVNNTIESTATIGQGVQDILIFEGSLHQ